MIQKSYIPVHSSEEQPENAREGQVMRIIAALVGITCIAMLANLNPSSTLLRTSIWARNHNEFLLGSCLGFLVVSLLPWVVYIRRKLFPRPILFGRRWSIAITVLLVIALLLGPLATAGYYLWLHLAKPTDAWGGFGPALGAIVITVVSHSIGLGFCILAFLAQLWQDRWRKILNAVTITYQILVYLILCAINSPSHVMAAPTPPTPSNAQPSEVFHEEKFPILSGEQVNEMEKKLKSIGFEACWFKTGSNFSSYSLVGKFEEVDFRIMIDHHDSPPRIEVKLEAKASPKEAEAARKLMEYLGYSKQTTKETTCEY